MKEEQWIQKIKERLNNYSEPLPPYGWNRLEEELTAKQISVIHKKAIIRFPHKMAVSAAAILVATICSIGLWILNESPRYINSAALAVINEKYNFIAPTMGGIIDLSNQYIGNVVSQIKPNTAVTQWQGSDVYPVVDVHGGRIEKIEESEYTFSRKDLENQCDTIISSDKHPIRKRKEIQLPDQNVIKNNVSSGSKWSMGISVANIGGLRSLLNGNGTDIIYQNTPSAGINYTSFDLLEASQGIVTIPTDQELVFKDGVPYLQNKSHKIASIHHKQPISFGLSLRKNLPKNFSIETGLLYTYLSSEVTFTDGLSKVDQKLHYIGIPLRANWNIIDRKAFSIYISGGGTIEKCIYGKIGNEVETVRPIQFSIMGAVGGQYNFNDKIGIYIEPGIAHFFNDGSSIQTIRKENPCIFTIQAGVRLSY